MKSLWQDLRFGVRMLWKQPGFTLIAVVALALGIGANTAIFSVVNAVLLRPLPFGDPDKLMMVWGSTPRESAAGFNQLPSSGAGFLDLREQNDIFEHLTAFRSWAWHLTEGDEPEQIWGARVSADFFETLGVKPIRGRAFTPDEDQPDHNKVVVIGHGLWQRRFGGDANIIGKTIALNNESYTVVGVMPPNFKFPGGANLLPGLGFNAQTEMWSPLALSIAESKNHGTLNLAVMGRLKQSIAFQQGQSEMNVIARRLQAQYPKEDAGLSINLVSLREQVVGDVRPALLILLGTVGIVLLIACTNVANLLLARAATRTKEIAIRRALGAGRLRLIRQLLTESVLLSFAGGALGLLLALWGSDLLVAFIPENIPRANEIGIDNRIFGFTLFVSLLTGLLFGLAPALQASRTDFNESLKEGARGASVGAGRNRVRSLLVIAEMSLALVLLIGAGLLIKSFVRLLHVDPGFNAEHVLTMDVLVPFQPGERYAKPEQQSAFFQQSLERVEKLPGVQAAGAVENLPLSGAVESATFTIEGRPAPAPGQEPLSDYTQISSDYFRAMNIPLMTGRFLTERDTKDAPGVIVVNEAFARRYFGTGENAVGKRIRQGGAEVNPHWNPPWLTIVGIIGNIKQTTLNADINPAMYMPHTQNASPFMTLVVRTTSDPANITAAVRQEIHAIDKDLPVSNVRTMEQVLATSVAERRFSMFLLGIFAALSLLLATIGLYGVMAYSITQRTHEIGIRMALGAGRRDVLKLVVGQGMFLALVGICIGLIAAFALTRVMSGLLYEVKATDPVIFAGIASVLTFVALIACYIPARRATRIDPMRALRYE